MTTTLDFRPKVVNLKIRAGDTISFRITASTEFIANREWTAQVRSVAGSAIVDATFRVVPPQAVDGPAYLTLSAEDTARLAAMAASSQVTRITGSAGRGVVLYAGVWDCQLAPPLGGDPTSTLACGSLEIEGDVTRHG